MKIKPTGLESLSLKLIAAMLALLSLIFMIRCFNSSDLTMDFSGAVFSAVGAALLYTFKGNEYVRLESGSVTLVRKFQTKETREERIDTILMDDLMEINYGKDMGIDRIESLQKLSFGWLKPKEIIFKTNNDLIPWDSVSYSKKELRKIITFVQTHSEAVIGAKLQSLL